MQQNKLVKGHIYFGLAFEDDRYTRPMVNTYEYQGIDTAEVPANTKGKRHCFRFVGTKDQLELEEHQLHVILDLEGLHQALIKWRAENPSLSSV